VTNKLWDRTRPDATNISAMMGEKQPLAPTRVEFGTRAGAARGESTPVRCKPIEKSDRLGSRACATVGTHALPQFRVEIEASTTCDDLKFSLRIDTGPDATDHVAYRIETAYHRRRNCENVGRFLPYCANYVGSGNICAPVAATTTAPLELGDLSR
jgi:hypothetical protein